jgi:hypothetical protein
MKAGRTESQLATGNLQLTTGLNLSKRFSLTVQTGTRTLSTISRTNCSACSDFFTAEE